MLGQLSVTTPFILLAVRVSISGTFFTPNGSVFLAVAELTKAEIVSSSNKVII